MTATIQEPNPEFGLRNKREWHAKRAKILRRDDFTCLRCGRQNGTLHVHHTYYAAGRAPWEYEDWSLRTLCHSCHGIVEGILRRMQRQDRGLVVYIADEDDVDRVYDAAFGPFSDHLMVVWHYTPGHWVDLRPLMAAAV